MSAAKNGTNLSFGKEYDDTSIDIEKDPVKFADIERYTGSTKMIDRISPVFGRALPVRYHQEPNMFPFYCFGGVCCKNSDLKNRFIIPIVQYDTDKEGKPISAKFEIKYLRLPLKAYKWWKTLAAQGIDITTKDYIVACEDDDFQKLTFTPLDTALWRKSPDFEAKVLAEAAKLMPKIAGCVARTITEEEYLTQRGEFVAPGDTGEEADAEVEGMFSGGAKV